MISSVIKMYLIFFQLVGENDSFLENMLIIV